jgi:hypothetical protein
MNAVWEEVAWADNIAETTLILQKQNIESLMIIN